MFDYLQYTDFKNKDVANIPKYSFLELDLYDNVKAIEYKKELNNTFLCFLERENTEENYLMCDNVHYLIYGSVFTNNAYAEYSGTRPFKINAGYLKKLFTDHKLDIVKIYQGLIYNYSL
jgi:hypothetical protein